MDPKQSRLSETIHEATSLLEDYLHLKEILQVAETKPADLRHASAILRRWFVEGMLLRVASPRVGRIEIETVNNNPIYRTVEKWPPEFFLSGGAAVHGIWISGLSVSSSPNSLSDKDRHPDSRVQLRVDNFRNQRVVYFKGLWFTRDQIIKYVANIDGGVHAGTVKDQWEQTLSAFKFEISLRLVPNAEGVITPQIDCKIGQPVAHSFNPIYDPTRVNGILLEILATIYFTVESPDVVKLIDAVRSELSA